MIATATLAVAAGQQGPHAIVEFAQSLNQAGASYRPTFGARCQFDVPGERAFHLLKVIDSGQLRQAFTDWVATIDQEPVNVLHFPWLKRVATLENPADQHQTRYGVLLEKVLPDIAQDAGHVIALNSKPVKQIRAFQF